MNANLKIKTTVAALAGAAAIAGLGVIGTGAAAADVPGGTLVINGQSQTVHANGDGNLVTQSGKVYNAFEDGAAIRLYVAKPGPIGVPSVDVDTILHRAGAGWVGHDEVLGVAIPGTSATLTPR